MSEQQRPGAYYDVDGTIFKSSLLEKIIETSIEKGVFPNENFEEAKAIWRQWQNDNNESTYLEYLRVLVVGYLANIAGVSVRALDEIIDEVNEAHRVRRFKFPRMLMEELSGTHHNIAISGSPERVVSNFVSDMPFLHVIGSQYEKENGIYTGRATATPDKARVREALISEGAVRAIGDIAVGDTMGDASILGAVQYPIMFNPSATLMEYGKQFGWPIVTEQKDNILVLEAIYNRIEEGQYIYSLSEPQSLIEKIDT